MTKLYRSNKRAFKWLIFICTLLFCSVFFYAKLGDAPLERWDEQTNYQVIKENLDSSQPLNLTLLGEPFFEKPPFWYYSTFLISKIFGFTVESTRIISAVSGLITISLIFLIARKFGGYLAGIISMLSFVSIGQNIIMNAGNIFSSHTYRSADLDPLQIMLFVLAFYLATFIKSRKSFIYLVTVVLAVAFMVKGPLAVLPLSIIWIYLWLHRHDNKLNVRYFIVSILLGVLIIMPWHLYMASVYGNMFWFNYFNYHILQRTTTTLEGHTGGFDFYFDVMFSFVRFSLWPLLIFSFIYLAKVIRKSFILTVCSFMIIGVLLGFSLVSTKLAWYVLPLYPFASILIGVAITNLLKSKQNVYYKILVMLVFIGLAGFGIMTNFSYIATL